MRRHLSLSLICTLLFAGIASSTTVIPPSFDALVAGANTIFVGEVVNTQAIWIGTPRGRAIKTLVDFRVEDVWTGSSGVVTRLEFMGGTIGEATMEVVGMPVFTIGQRAVLFVSPERAASPLVGFMHGRLRVERDYAGVDRVRTHDGRSLGGVNEVGPNRPSYLLSITPMRLSDLASAVKSRSAAGLVRRGLGEGGRAR
jgi:hypothetical protein